MRGFVASSFFAFFNFFAIAVLLFGSSPPLLSQRLGRCEFLGFLQALCHRCSPLWKLPRYLFFKGRVFSSFLAFFKLFAMAALLFTVCPLNSLYEDQFRESTCKWLANVRDKINGTHPPWNLADDDVGLANTPHDRLARVLT
jgi:hypothetical protein